MDTCSPGTQHRQGKVRVGAGGSDPTASAQIREEEGGHQATLTGQGPWSIQRDPAQVTKSRGAQGGGSGMQEVETRLRL